MTTHANSPDTSLRLLHLRSESLQFIFYICGAVIGAAGGTVQSASRTLMVYHVTPETAASGFGLYGMSGKATAFLAPGLITLATLASGSARIGIAPLIGLFLLGLVLLVWVNPKGETAK